jgi:cytoskeleton protein RodZ
VSHPNGAGDALVEGPGPALTRAREARGLSEQQAAEQLNLDVSVVYALESGDLAALGAPVFARGHLKRYGALLGLPEDQLLAAYERARTQPEQPSLVPHSRQDMAPTRDRRAWPWAVGGALLFLLAAGLIAYVSQFGLALPSRLEEPMQGASSTTDTGVPAPLETPATGVTERVSGPVANATTTGIDAAVSGAADPGSAPAPEVASATPAPALEPGHVVLGMSFSADSWTEIYDGAGKAVLYDLGRAGSQRTITAQAPLSVTLGNAPAVTLSVNGRAMPMPPVPAGQTVARFKVQPDGTLN